MDRSKLEGRRADELTGDEWFDLLLERFGMVRTGQLLTLVTYWTIRYGGDVTVRQLAEKELGFSRAQTFRLLRDLRELRGWMQDKYGIVVDASVSSELDAALQLMAERQRQLMERVRVQPAAG